MSALAELAVRLAPDFLAALVANVVVLAAFYRRRIRAVAREVVDEHEHRLHAVPVLVEDE